MRQLTTNESILMLIGAILMVVGAGMIFFKLEVVAPWFFMVGAIAFASMQLKQRYEGTNFTIRRLRKIMIAGDICFLLSGVMMFENSYKLLLPMFIKLSPDMGYLNYLRYFHNNWVVLLLVAAVLELYSTHRITHELNKDAKKI